MEYVEILAILRPKLTHIVNSTLISINDKKALNSRKPSPSVAPHFAWIRSRIGVGGLNFRPLIRAYAGAWGTDYAQNPTPLESNIFKSRTSNFF